MSDLKLLLQAAPFLRRGITTPGLMGEVIIALIPVIALAMWFFGLAAALVLIAATIGAVGTEWWLGPGRRRGASLGDRTAILTGILLGLCLPPGMPLWMAFIGGVSSVGLGKLIFGGLGQNLFNPALVGRAFLQAAFPTAITSFTMPGPDAGFLTLPPSTLAVPFMKSAEIAAENVDVITTATPLATIKFDGEAAPLIDLFSGNTAGSLGETSALVLLLVCLILAWRRVLDWRIPLSILVTVGLFASIIWMFDRELPSPLYSLFSGGLLFGAVFMATDPVTSPIAPRGAWIYGIGIGILVVLIRFWGGLAEGVMYAILLMNAATPLIERIDQPRPFGRDFRGKALS